MQRGLRGAGCVWGGRGGNTLAGLVAPLGEGSVPVGLRRVRGGDSRGGVVVDLVVRKHVLRTEGTAVAHTFIADVALLLGAPAARGDLLERVARHRGVDHIVGVGGRECKVAVGGVCAGGGAGSGPRERRSSWEGAGRGAAAVQSVGWVRRQCGAGGSSPL